MASLHSSEIADLDQPEQGVDLTPNTLADGVAMQLATLAMKVILNVPLAGSDDVDVEANGAEGNAVESNGAGNCGDDDDDVLYIEPNEVSCGRRYGCCRRPVDRCGQLYSRRCCRKLKSIDFFLRCCTSF